MGVRRPDRVEQEAAKCTFEHRFHFSPSCHACLLLYTCPPQTADGCADLTLNDSDARRSTPFTSEATGLCCQHLTVFRADCTGHESLLCLLPGPPPCWQYRLARHNKSTCVEGCYKIDSSSRSNTLSGPRDQCALYASWSLTGTICLEFTMQAG